MSQIKISDFPKDKLYILVNKEFRVNLFKESLKRLKLRNYFELSIYLNKKLKSKFNGGDIKYWIEGERSMSLS
ncbi:hypothetical protein J4466_03400 [Candidatus Pacearchaeota archaeon]|nr:hypothetical protein [Candidatus Pacearchaeota archaeon]